MKGSEQAAAAVAGLDAMATAERGRLESLLRLRTDKLRKAIIESATVRAAHGRLSALSVFLCESVLYGAFVWARRALKSPTLWFPVRVGSERRGRCGPAGPAMRKTPSLPRSWAQFRLL
jgi:hypothetical protein